jgi:hypothetical protein
MIAFGEPNESWAKNQQKLDELTAGAGFSINAGHRLFCGGGSHAKERVMEKRQQGDVAFISGKWPLDREKPTILFIEKPQTDADIFLRRPIGGK